jgi:dephospho-CoA kinase
MPFVVALTGGIGSGKSSAARFFAALGAAIVDTDEIAHDLTRPGRPAVTEIALRFGHEYLLPDGGLDRAKLRQRVFADPAAKNELEAVLHPLIRAEAERQIASASAPYTVVVVPLLFESGDAYRKLARRVVSMDCGEDRQIARTMARSSLAEKEVRAIMATQASREERRSGADILLNNDGGPEELRAQVAALHARLLEEASPPPAATATTVCQKPRIVSE